MSTWDHLFLVHFPSLAASLIVQSSYNHTLKVSDSKSSLFVAWTYVLNPHVLALTDLKVLINVIIICSSTLIILIFYHKILKCSTPKSWCLSSTSPQHPAFPYRNLPAGCARFPRRCSGKHGAGGSAATRAAVLRWGSGEFSVRNRMKSNTTRGIWIGLISWKILLWMGCFCETLMKNC